MLVNRYYLSFVKFEGVWYEGRHPALIETNTFEQVQAVRTARAAAARRCRSTRTNSRARSSAARAADGSGSHPTSTASAGPRLGPAPSPRYSSRTSRHPLPTTGCAFYWVVRQEGIHEHTGPISTGYAPGSEYRHSERIPVPYADADLAVDELIASHLA
jgi:hypothetical protein